MSKYDSAEGCVCVCAHVRACACVYKVAQASLDSSIYNIHSCGI